MAKLFKGASMGFIAALRQADDDKAAAAVAANEKHPDQELETAVRRRMRVHPAAPGVPEKTELRPGTNDGLRPIVSIHGRDVKEEEIDRSDA